MFALNLNVIFHLCPATEGWILDMSRKQIYGEGIWGTLNHVQLDMMVISGKCKLSFYALKKSTFYQFNSGLFTSFSRNFDL